MVNKVLNHRKKVRKAIVPAAGFGTRFLPQTKAMPKEMLPVVDKPIIQHVVEELVGAGIEDIIIVTGHSKRSIEDHFDKPSQDLVANLRLGKKGQLIDEIEAISNLANFVYIRQKGPYGNATPIMNAAHLIGDEPFIYTWSDDFILAEPTSFKQMVDAYDELDGSILSCVKATTDKDYNRYGFVGGDEVRPGVIQMKSIIEKPGKHRAPSNYASVSGYIIEPDIFRYLQEDLDELEEGHEFILQPTMQRMIMEGHKFFGYEIKGGKFYDTGNKLEYLKTVVDFALKHDEIKDDFRDYLRSLKF